MTIWVDAQLSPAGATWISSQFPVQCLPLRDLGLRDATDRQIYAAGQQAGAVVMTKDSDFVELIEQYGAPPQVIWLRCGNTSNPRLKQILSTTLSQALLMLEAGEPLIEIDAT